MYTSTIALFAAAIGIANAFPTSDVDYSEVEDRSIEATCYLRAYSGTACSGAAGGTYTVSSGAGGTCFTPTGSKHSYIIGDGCPTLTISQYGVANCGGTNPVIAHQGPGCHPFNNRYSVVSFNAAYT